ncbi:MAG: hypothetical protein ACYDIB_00045 [Desulfobulbia bacterium]|nr:MAG: hypothetical protein CVU58_00025 [Deltaproteobacteria bacterium HGW-Deltaproteobacteria-16]
MTDVAKYAFLPWLRVGIASEISEQDALGQPPVKPTECAKLRASIDVTLQLQDVSIADSSLHTEPVAKTAHLIGPGDIMSISRDAIVRTEPRDQVSNFEANCFPYVEFYEEDFPWRYTPAAPGAEGGRRLRPWLLLLVLEDDEYTVTANPKNPQGLAVLTIKQTKINEVLFPHTQSWAWAHVHFYEDLTNTHGTPAYASEVTQRLQTNPDSAVSRLLCPRKLQAEKSYRAFLVPAFETGRLAGLDKDPKDVLAQTPSWRKYSGASDAYPTEFPIYFQWGFRTGLSGDFKSLATLLQPKVLGPKFGQRPMDITRPGFGMDTLGAANLESPTLGLGGALKPVGFQKDAWPKGPNDRNYRDLLAKILNISKDLQDKNSTLLPHPLFFSTSLGYDPIVTPHIYGKFHSLITRLGTSGNPAWVETLNLDPRHRATAGLGGQVVQEHQEEFMESAWKQVGEVDAANQKLRELELAKQVNQALYAKRIAPLGIDKLMHITAPMHRAVLTAGQTVQESVRQSRIPVAAKSAAMRKLVRPGKKIIRRMNRMGLETNGDKVLIHEKMIQHFNIAPETPSTFKLTAAAPKVAPNMAVAVDTVQKAVTTAVNDFQTDKMLVQHALLDALAELTKNQTIPPPALLKTTVAEKVLTSGAIALANRLIDKITTYAFSPTEITVTVEAEMFKEVYGKRSTGKYKDGVLLKRPLGKKETERITSATSLDEVIQYRSILNAFGGAVQKRPGVTSARPIIANLADFGANLWTRLKPEINLHKRVGATIKIWSASENQYVTPTGPIMAYPEFREPVYEHLHKISKDFIIPNCNDIPQNSLTILEPNSAFIEAYMAGLNHEMARELLWREYPTDQRGSYFRKFWDTKDNITAEPSLLNPDINPLPGWVGDLGQNSLRSDNLLVLVIRGELLLKYPNTVVFAQRAKWVTPGKKRTLAGTENDLNNPDFFKFPVIHARLDPDIMLFGFNLPPAEAHGNASDPGWFFVLKERPGHISFGLDEVAGTVSPANDLNHLTWKHFAPNPGTSDVVPCLDLTTANLTAGAQTKWDTLNAADLASYLFRNPVMLARHAREMIA